MIWWQMAFHGAAHDGRTGYQAMSSTQPGTCVGLFLDDGTPVPAWPPYNATTVATGVAPPSWAASVSDFGAPVAPAPVAAVITPMQFVLLLTPAEVTTWKNTTDPIAEQFWVALSVAQDVDLGSPIVTHGLAYVTATGLLAAGRSAQILSNTPPGG
jgi:hypothetical protein